MGDTAPAPFYGRHLEDSAQHVKNVKLWLATKKHPAHDNPPSAGDAHHIASIAYFASSLKEAAWLNSERVGTAPDTIRTFDQLVTSFLLQFAFDQSNQWREIRKFDKITQEPLQTTENYIRIMQEAGQKI